MQPRCAMRFESHTPKSLATRKSFFCFFSLAMRKHIRLIWNHRKMPEKNLWKSCDVGLRCENSGCFLRSSDAKCLRFGLSLRFGLRCERPRCQIASDVGRAMRTTKSKQKNNLARLFLILEVNSGELKKAVAVSEEKIQQRSRRRGRFSSSHFPCRKMPKPWQG